MLTNAQADISKVCESIIDYSLFMHAKKLEHGTQIKKIKEAANFYGYTLGNLRKTINEGENILSKNFKVVTSINKDTIEDFRMNHKTPFEIIVFISFCALRSIIGKKPYCKLENKFLLSRMAGFEKSVSIQELPGSIRSYANEYQMRKIKKELINHWGLKHYSRFTRGFYVSFTMPKVELIFHAEKKRKKYLEKEKSNEQKEALKKVMLQLYGS